MLFRSLIAHSARNGFLYAMERANGQIVYAKPYFEGINWTKGIDQKTGKPVDYDPKLDIQVYSGVATPQPGQPTKRMCPSPSGGNNFWPTAYSRRTGMLYIPALTACANFTNRPQDSNAAARWRGGVQTPTDRYETDMIMADPVSGDIKKRQRVPYPNYAGNLTTAGGLVFTGFTDGTFMALDDESLEPVWKINVGTGFNAPPMTFEVGGKQYIGILSGISGIAAGKHVFTPELKEQRNQTLLWVFSL